MSDRPDVPAWFGRRVTREREARNWSLREMGRRIGVSGEALRKIESGRNVTLSSVIGIADAVRMQVPVLLTAPACEACDEAPPAGFTCVACGREGAGVRPW